jgi:hypothetical protein
MWGAAQLFAPQLKAAVRRHLRRAAQTFTTCSSSGMVSARRLERFILVLDAKPERFKLGQAGTTGEY